MVCPKLEIISNTIKNLNNIFILRYILIILNEMIVIKN